MRPRGAARRSLALLALLAAATTASAATWADFRHEYLLPEQRSGLLRIHGFAGGAWGADDPPRGGDRVVTVRPGAASGLWGAGEIGARIRYFAQVAYFYDTEKFEAGPARVDLDLVPDLLTIRAGRLFFPFGLEPRTAPPPVNSFIDRPVLRIPIRLGVGFYGELFEGVLNWFAGDTEAFARAWTDTIAGVGEDTPRGRALGGRVGLSPQPGVEFGFSYLEEEDGVLRGVDFSTHAGPLLLGGEWSRFRPGGASDAPTVDIAYARLAHRIVEYSEHFESIEIDLGADYLDPDKRVSGDRSVEYIGGLSVAPRPWIVVRGGYRIRDREGARHDRILAQIMLFW